MRFIFFEESDLFTKLFPNTELNADLKLLTRTPGRLNIGDGILGAIVRDGEEHYIGIELPEEVAEVVVHFMESTVRNEKKKMLKTDEIGMKSKKVKRNIPFCPGKHLNCTIRPDDLHVRLNFKELHFGPGFDIDAFAIEVMMEVRKALNEAMDLIEEKLNLGA